MDKEKALKELEEEHEEGKIAVDYSVALCEKIEPLLPLGWKSEYNVTWKYLTFSKREKANAAEFRAVCGVVDKVLGRKLIRNAGGTESFPYIYGSSYFCLPIKDKTIWMDVRVELNKPDGCKFIFKEVKEMKPVVNDSCLGIRKEKPAEPLE